VHKLLHCVGESELLRDQLTEEGGGAGDYFRLAGFWASASIALLIVLIPPRDFGTPLSRRPEPMPWVLIGGPPTLIFVFRRRSGTTRVASRFVLHCNIGGLYAD
jgi:hypothetical protein